MDTEDPRRVFKKCFQKKKNLSDGLMDIDIRSALGLPYTEYIQKVSIRRRFVGRKLSLDGPLWSEDPYKEFEHRRFLENHLKNYTKILQVEDYPMDFRRQKSLRKKP